MAGIYGIVSNTPSEPSQLTRGQMGVASANVTLAAAAGAVKRGMVMGQITASYKWVPVVYGAADGSQIARGILMITEDETVAADSIRRMGFAGEYRKADIIWPGAPTQAQKDAAAQQLADAGIIIYE